MGWRAIESQGGHERGVLDLGPYRESTRPRGPGTSVALVRSWRSTTFQASGWSLIASFCLVLTLATLFGSGPSRVEVNGSVHTHASKLEALRHDPWIWLFPSGAIVFAYVAAAMWVNETRIEVAGRTIAVRRGPLPWPGRVVEVAGGSIQRLYVQERVTENDGDRTGSSYRVVARLFDGRDVVVDSGMKRYEDARVLEQWVERRQAQTTNVSGSPIA